MSYLEKLLVPDETVLYRAHRSVVATFLPLTAGALALIAVAAGGSFVPGALPFIWFLPVLPAPWLLFRYLFWKNKIYLVTNYRVLKVEGVISKSHVDASLDKINDMALSQSLLGRIFNYGDLAISTANETAGVTYHLLDKPIEFKRLALMSREARGRDSGSESDGSDPLGQLERLGVLREKGVVTEAEFTAKKAELLGRIR